MGVRKALEIALLGEAFTADDALRLGLINRIAEDGQGVVDAALTLAGQITGFSSVAQQAIRTATAAAFDNDLETGMAIERQRAARAFASADAREGVSAFLDKRPPRFSDR